MTLPLVATILPPREGFGPSTTGAIGTIARLFARAPGFRSLIITGSQKGEAYADPPSLSVRPTPWRFGNVNIRYASALTWHLARLRPALIEVHNRPELALWLARRFPVAPVILFLNNDPQEMRSARTAAERATLLRTLARVATSSCYLRRRLLEGIAQPAAPAVVLPNPIDLAELPPPGARQPLILWAGRVTHEKGPDAFVAACAAALVHLPGWRAELIGADRFRIDSPDTAFVRSVRTAAERAGIRMPGYQGREYVLEAMGRAAIAVVPSRWQEPFGLVALEALASGAALVCSGRGGLRDVAGEAALYADPDDTEALATAIRTLADDPARRSALAQAGRERAKDFDAPVIAARLAALRHDVLAGRGG